ncbi:MAG: hypothetical protein GXO14_02575 [Thermococci archaeon]|nr:hypothetical protein [Thermococci archaeon]
MRTVLKIVLLTAASLAVPFLPVAPAAVFIPALVLLLLLGTDGDGRRTLVGVILFVGLLNIPLLLRGPLIFFGYFVRVLLMTLLGYALVATTSTGELISALRKLGFPEGVTMALCVMVRSLPMMSRLAGEVRQAQRGRGARGIRGTLSLAVPLLVLSIKLAEEVGESLEGRAFGGRVPEFREKR